MSLLRIVVLCLATFLVMNGCASAPSKPSFIRISGRLTDFDGQALSGGDVVLKVSDTVDGPTVQTDEHGAFTLTAPATNYRALYVCKDHGTKYLEFWFWEPPSNKDLRLDVKIGGLEVYGIKAWRNVNGAIAYFRPMSLKRYQALGTPDKSKPVLIAPQLGIHDVHVTLDGRAVTLWGINKVKEFVDGSQSYLDAYTIAFDASAANNDLPEPELCIEIFDSKTGETGRGCAVLR